MSIRVLVVDDQALVRTGFRMILETQADIEVVGEAADGSAALDLAAALTPDVVLMDIRMPGMDGIAATRVLFGGEGSARAAASVTTRPRVIILTTYDLDEYVFEALEVGASGFLLKDVRPEDLVQGVRVVAAGDALLAPAVTGRLIAEFAGRARRATVAPDPRIGTADPPRAGGPRPHGQGLVQFGDRRRRLCQREHGQDPRGQDLRQAATAGPGPGGYRSL